MARIATIGSALQDIYLIDHDDLAPTKIGEEAIFGKVLVGSKVEIDKIHYGVGGGGLNSAVTFARNGHEVVFLGNIARDSAGAAIMKALDDEGIDNSYVNFLNYKSTGTSVILLDSKSGERTILTCRGASNEFSNLKADDLDLIQPDWLYATTLHGDIKTLASFFKKAQKLGAKIAFNPGKMELTQAKELVKLLSYVDILLVNKSEASEIVPGKVLVELLYHLNGYVPTTIITDGPMGGIAGDRKEIYRFGIYEDTKVKDATGAGDAFGAGFLAHFANGYNFRDSLVFASANSTSVVSKIGASNGALSEATPLHPMPIQKL